jgi:hypothetical protein
MGGRYRVGGVKTGTSEVVVDVEEGEESGEEG